ncbi:hypothetical protein HY415_00895 [Candidatus Kaiserbacteria bacterium]|nr:hypothetical protein [Candidatus Kaiserbacteria bacterium]
MKKGAIILIATVAVLVIAGLIWKSREASAPQPFVIEMVQGERVAAWDFKGAYTGNAELEAKADAEIARLIGLLGSKQYPDYTLYVSIANQYGLLGDGARELAYLQKALAINSTTTGLAWHNAGQLFALLGAYQTARMALEKAATTQPITQYQQALVDFLLARFPADTAAIKNGQQAMQDSLGEANR